jgi:CHASE1-domain containing sensor protein
LISLDPAISGLGWMPLVRDEDRPEFEASLRENGYTKPFINDFHESGDTILAPRRPFYFPLYYLVSSSLSSTLMGFDPTSQEDRRLAIERARNWSAGRRTVNG